MVTIQLDEETLTTFIFAAAQSSCAFDRNAIKENQMWQLDCCDYNEPIYKVIKQINLDEIQDEDSKGYLKEVEAKAEEFYNN